MASFDLDAIPTWGLWGNVRHVIRDAVLEATAWVDPREFGAVGDDVADDTTALQDAIDAAVPIWLPPDLTFRTTAPLAFTDRAVPIRGAGSHFATIHGDHTGPILDFSELGWDSPSQAESKVTYQGFMLVGNQTDATNRGIYITADSLGHGPSSLLFRDVSIKDTGGECVYTDWAQFVDFIDCVFNEPPTEAVYVRVKGFNAGSLRRCLFRGYGGGIFTQDGILRIEDATSGGGTAYQSEGVLVDACVTEFCHAATGSQMIYVEGGSQVVFRNWHRFDDGAEAATDTYYVRFGVSSLGANGGNEWQGWVPGDDGGGWAGGIEVASHRNGIRGAAGYADTNVVLTGAADYNQILLVGQTGGGGGTTRVVDDTTGVNNTWMDFTGGTITSSGIT